MKTHAVLRSGGGIYPLADRMAACSVWLVDDWLVLYGQSGSTAVPRQTLVGPCTDTAPDLLASSEDKGY